MAKKLRYLNSQSRYDIILMCSLRSHLLDMIKRWHSLNRTPIALKWMRAAATFTGKARDEIFDELDDAEGKRILAMAEHASFEMTYATAVVTTAQPGEKLYNLEVTEEGKTRIAEAMAQCHCMTCSGINCASCYIKDMFMAWDMPPLNEIVDEHFPCPYWCKEV